MPRYCFNCQAQLAFTERTLCSACVAAGDLQEEDVPPHCPCCEEPLGDEGTRLVCPSCGYSYDVGGE